MLRTSRLAVFTALALLLLCVRAFAQDLSGLYLTWDRDPTTSITINWVDLYPDSTTKVFYREAGAAEWRSDDAKHLVVKPSTLQRRYLTLTDLKPGISYEFAIGKVPKERADVSWNFRTMPAEMNRPIRFIAGGDMMHTRATLDAMSRQVAPLEPDFVLLGGDLAYENGQNATRIVDWLGSWKQMGMTKDRRLIPMVLTIGNHEVRGNYNGKIPDDAPYFYRLFSFPDERAYYALDFGKYLSLLVLDSGHTNPIEGAQTKWLEGALAARAGQRWIFSSYHFPAYGTSKAGEGKLPIDIPRAITIRQHWVSLFERFGLSAAFEHDHHTFKRTHRLRNHQRDDDYGILYLGDGAWGVTPRAVPDLKEAWYLAKAASRNHFWIVELRPDGTWLARAMDPAGEVFDEVQTRSPRPRAVR